MLALLALVWPWLRLLALGAFGIHPDDAVVAALVGHPNDTLYLPFRVSTARARAQRPRLHQSHLERGLSGESMDDATEFSASRPRLDLLWASNSEMTFFGSRQKDLRVALYGEERGTVQ